MKTVAPEQQRGRQPGRGRADQTRGEQQDRAAAQKAKTAASGHRFAPRAGPTRSS